MFEGCAWTEGIQGDFLAASAHDLAGRVPIAAQAIVPEPTKVALSPREVRKHHAAALEEGDLLGQGLVRLRIWLLHTGSVPHKRKPARTPRGRRGAGRDELNI